MSTAVMSREQVKERAKKAIATTIERGETLWLDGYTLALLAARGTYAVTTPERRDTKTAELYTITYTVDAIGSTCNCDQFQHHGICKHLIAMQKALCDALEAQEKAAALLAGIGGASLVPSFPQSFPVPGAGWSDAMRTDCKPGASPIDTRYVRVPVPVVAGGGNLLINPAADFD